MRTIQRKPPSGREGGVFSYQAYDQTLQDFCGHFMPPPPNRCDSNRPIVPLCAYSNLAVGALRIMADFIAEVPPVNRFDSLKND